MRGAMEPTIPEPPPSDVTTDVVDVSEIRAGFAAEGASSRDLGVTDAIPLPPDPDPEDPTERGPIPAEVAAHAPEAEERDTMIDPIAPRITSVAPLAVDVPASPRGRAITTLGTLAIPPLRSSSTGGWLLLAASLLLFAAGVVAVFTFGPGAKSPASPHAPAGRASPRVAEIVSARGVDSAR